MGHYARESNCYFVARPYTPPFDRLPVGTYVVKYHPERGYYFEIIDDLELPKKVYGDLNTNRNRIISTFEDRPASTGVMLAGEKGSGKTLLAKGISAELRARDVPTIVVNSPFHGDGFATLIQNMSQPAMFLFDEFEKVYDKEQQEAMLTLLDGVYPSKKLFMLTTNDKYRIDNHMKNRPGRLFYMLTFTGLDPAFIRDYCNENVVNKENIDGAVLIASMFNSMNFDMLKALVEEMNRYDEPARDAMRLLNVNPEFDGEATYRVQLEMNGELLDDHRLPYVSWKGNPLNSGIAVPFYGIEETDGPDFYELEQVGRFEHRRLNAEQQKAQKAWLSKMSKGGKRPTQVGIAFTPHDITNASPDGIVMEKDGYKATLVRTYTYSASYFD